MSEHEERLFRLSEQLAAALAAGESVDVEAWARRFDVPADEVGQVRRALEWLEEPPEEAVVAPVEIPRPELPDDYELLEELGRGGMGIVYRARQKSLAREVALKVLLPGELVLGEALARFRREAKSLARLRHRHIVSIHDVGEHAGRVYYTMDLIDGAPLSRLVADGELSVARSVRLVRQVASAIAYVHQRGLLHRDLKPQNVLVDEAGDAFVVDFGLARDDAGRADPLTGSGRILGTPAYMAPEQARGDRARIGEATDVYAMGAVLYECLTGRAPFAGLSIAETIHAVLHREPAPMRKLDPRIPPPLEWIVMRAMAKDPADRYPTAQALQEDLERFEEGRTVRAEPPSFARRARAFVRRERKVVLAVIATLLLAGVSFQALVRPRLGPSREALLLVAQELAASGEQEAADALIERLLSDARGDLPTFRSWVLTRLKRVEELRAAADAEGARELVAEVAGALRERRASLGEGDPLSDAERLALDALRSRTLAAEGEPVDLFELDDRRYSAGRPPAFSVVWSWADEAAVAAVPSDALVPDSLRWFWTEILAELADPAQARASTLRIALAILDERRATRAWVAEDRSSFEVLVAAAARFGDGLPAEVQAGVRPEPGVAFPWIDHAAALSAQRWIELCAAPARDGSALAARWLSWAADLPPGADDAVSAVAVLSAEGAEAERLRRDAALALFREWEAEQSARSWLGTRKLAASALPDDPVAALANGLGVSDLLDDRRALLRAFDAARSNDRRAFHVLFELLDDGRGAPRWPGLGWSAPEPAQLATAWHLRWGDRGHEGWRIRVGRFEREGWRASLRLAASSVLVPDDDGTFAYVSDLAVESERRRDWPRDRRLFLDGTASLWSSVDRGAARLAVEGRVGWGAGGLAARVERPTLRPDAGLFVSAPSRTWLEPETPSILARVRERGSSGTREWPAREVLVVARLERADGVDESWARADWDAEIVGAIARLAEDRRSSRSRRRIRGAFPGDARRALEEVLAVAAELPQPAALPILRELAVRPSPALDAARLAAGDAAAAGAHGRYPDWYGRLWLDAEDARLRALGRARLVLGEVPGAVRVEIAQFLRARGEEVPREFLGRVAEQASRSRQTLALVIVGWIFGGIVVLGVALGIGSAVRSGKIPLDPRTWPWRGQRGYVATMFLLVVPAFGRLPHPGWNVVLVAASVLLSVVAALGRRTLRGWIPAAAYSTATAGLFLDGPCWMGSSTTLFDLAGLLLVPCLFRTWVPRGRSAWRHLIWLFYLYALWPLVVRFLGSLSLWLETCGALGARIEGLRLYAFVESFGVPGLQSGGIWLFWLYTIVHDPGWPTTGPGRGREVGSRARSL